MTRREQETEQTRQLIVEAARVLFADNGYDNVTVRDIASRAGISHGTIYLHFQDKSDLLYQVSEEQFRRLLDRLRRLPRTRPAIVRLKDALLEVLRFGIREPNDYQLMMGFREALGGGSSEQWGPMADQVGAFFESLVRDALQQRATSEVTDEDTERLANLMLIAMLDGVVLNSIIQKLDEVEADHLAEFTVDCVVSGFATITSPNHADNEGAE